MQPQQVHRESGVGRVDPITLRPPSNLIRLFGPQQSVTDRDREEVVAGRGCDFGKAGADVFGWVQRSEPVAAYDGEVPPMVPPLCRSTTQLV